QRLAALMGCGSVSEFERAHRAQTQTVRGQYDNLLKAEEPGPRRSLPDLEDDRSAWLALLAGSSVREPEKAYLLIREFVRGPGYVHVSPRTAELALRLL